MKKKKHHKHRKKTAPTAPRPVNPLQQRMEDINRIKPIIAAARQREQKIKNETEAQK